MRSVDGSAFDYGEGLEPGERSPAVYAAGAVPSRGRLYPEGDCPTRSPFQRDRDRILHSTAFRRLIHKTQVFVFHEGDHYRTRLTHSLEVAQIARTVSRQLRLDEDLAEALALAHDLGHPPFGHAGERALDAAMQAWGGFDHNAQSLRAVMHLERKYLSFDGLNLTWETLEGLAKHNGPLAGPAAKPASALSTDHGHDAVMKVLRAVEAWRSIEPQAWASAEAQVAALADDIAYVTHDIDDGLRAGLLTFGDLMDAPVTAGIVRPLKADVPEGTGVSRLIYEVTRRMITLLIRDVVLEARRRLASLAPRSPEDIRRAEVGVVQFSQEMGEEVRALKQFLMGRVYRAARVMDVMNEAGDGVIRLFERYFSDPSALPPAWQAQAEGRTERQRARLVADFVAGMTDRYAMAEHQRLFDAVLKLR